MSNFNMGELPLQVFVCCDISRRSKRRQCSFISGRRFSQKQQQQQYPGVGRRGTLGLINKRRTENSTQQSFLYRCPFATMLMENQRGDRRVSSPSGFQPLETAARGPTCRHFSNNSSSFLAFISATIIYSQCSGRFISDFVCFNVFFIVGRL